ncbi:MAG: hypothetical protein ACRDYZ_11975 [Acidimicrobiales bacterium]
MTRLVAALVNAACWPLVQIFELADRRMCEWPNLTDIKDGEGEKP